MTLEEDAVIAELDRECPIAETTDAFAEQFEAARARRAKPTCAYERKRGTEQECSRELWRVRALTMTKGLAVPYDAKPVISCTLHLPVLLTDRFVLEYQLVRVRSEQ